MSLEVTLASLNQITRNISIRASDDIQEGLLLHPYENDADIGMRYQQPVRRLLSAVSQEKEKCEHPAFWIVAINVEYRGVNHLANIRTVQRRARARRGSCVADASQII